MRIDKLRRTDPVNPQALLVAKDALSHSAHFKTYLEWVEDQLNEALLALQSPEVIACTNRHFMISGKVEAFDEIIDQMTKAY